MDLTKVTQNLVVLGDVGVGKLSIVNEWNKLQQTKIRMKDNTLIAVNVSCPQRTLQEQQIHKVLANAKGVLIVFDLTERQTFKHLKGWINLVKQYCSKESVIQIAGTKSDLCTSHNVVVQSSQTQQNDQNDDPDTTQYDELDDLNVNLTQNNFFNGTAIDFPVPTNTLVQNQMRQNEQNWRQVSFQEAFDFSRTLGFMYFEISAVTSYNIKLVFEQLAQSVYENQKIYSITEEAQYEEDNQVDAHQTRPQQFCCRQQ